MAASVEGTQVKWSLERDAEGHRDYKVTHLVRSETTDGPATAINASGLPAVGSVWNFDDDIDLWAFCLPTASVTIHQEKEGDPNRWWRVTQTFTTRPHSRCQDESIEDPLLEPQKVSGSFVKYTKEVTHDRNDVPIMSSSKEFFRGPQVEFDHNRPTVRVGQNVASLGLATFSQMIDKVNDAALWGLPVRTIKLSNVTWERKYYGLCNVYYTRVFDFDINFDTFDREIVDEGTKWLDGDIVGEEGATAYQKATGMVKTNPVHFARAKDRRGENMRVLLDGNGEPLGDDVDPVKIDVEYYGEANLLLLGIPTSF